MPAGFQSSGFQQNAFDTTYFASLGLTEGADTASFTAKIADAIVTFVVTEGADTASFTSNAKAVVTFVVTEGADIASFTSDSTTTFTFSIAEEGKDIASFSSLTGSIVTFDILEGADTAFFHGIAADFYHGDADHICVAPELNKIILQPAIDTETVNPDGRTYSVPDEYQRIEVSQIGASRKDT